MAGEVEKLSGKLGIDTTDFKTALGAANREIRVLESSFKASAAGLADWTKDASGLEARVRTLTSQIDVQRLKVEALRAEHLRLAEAHGANSRAAQDAEIKLNNEVATLNRMQSQLIESESALQEMTEEELNAGKGAEQMGKDIEESGSKVETFKSILGGVGAVTRGAITGILAVATAAITAVAAMGGLGINAATTAEHFADLSAKTSINVETLQEMNYVSDILGTSLDTVVGAQARLIRSMGSATEQADDYQKKLTEAAKSGKSLEDIELGETADAFQTLGVSVRDAGGQLRDSEDVFNDVINALGKIPNESERDVLAMQILGKSAQELNPLIKAGADELERLKNEAREMGAVMSEDDVEAASAFKDQLDGLKLGFQGILAQIGLAFIPGLSGIADQAKGYLQDLVGVVQGSGGDVGKIAEGVGGLLGRIVTDLAGQAPQLLQVGLGLIQSLISAILSALPTLLPAAIQIITSLINFIAQALPTLIQAGVQILLTLVNALIENLPMLVDAALQAVIALATGLAAALPELIPAVVQALITIVETLIANLPMLVEAATQLILALVEGLIAALPILIPAIPVLVQALIDALMIALPQLVGAAGELVGALVTGLILAAPLLLDSALKILESLFKALTSKQVSMKTLGQDFIKGFADGVLAAGSYLYDVVAGVVQEMLATIANALGISSPSKVGRGFGRNLFESQALGALDALGGVQRTFAWATQQLADAMQAPVRGGSTTTSSVESNSFDIFGNVIIQGSTTPGSLGEALRGRRF